MSVTVVRTGRSVLVFILFSGLMPCLRAGEGLKFDRRMSDCENRWVVMKPDAGESTFHFGFVYIDPQAGFTFNYEGCLALGPEGRVIRVKSPLEKEKVSFKLRLDAQHNGVVALLPDEAIATLGLEKVPSWLDIYKDGSDPVTHKVRWGFQYNHMGASDRALEYLESAWKAKPDAKGLAFELAFAYNATKRYDQALGVLQAAGKQVENDLLLQKELAYAYMCSGRHAEAVKVYQRCLTALDTKDDEVRTELAMNISQLYGAMGDEEQRKQWWEKARSWVPKDSPLAKYFKEKQ